MWIKLSVAGVMIGLIYTLVYGMPDIICAMIGAFVKWLGDTSNVVFQQFETDTFIGIGTAFSKFLMYGGWANEWLPLVETIAIVSVYYSCCLLMVFYTQAMKVMRG